MTKKRRVHFQFGKVFLSPMFIYASTHQSYPHQFLSSPVFPPRHCFTLHCVVTNQWYLFLTNRRLSGFHPIAKATQPLVSSGREASSSSDSLLPYSSIGEKMEAILNRQHPVSDNLFASKSSTTLGGTIGRYRARQKYLSEDVIAASVSDSRLEGPKESRTRSPQGACNSTGTAVHVQSKWNQFLPFTGDED